jgi:adenylate cyclase
MNTSARIQAVCNKFRVRMLISKNLLDLLDLPPLQYHPKRVGIFELKGKKQLVELYTFEEAMEPRYVGDGGISAT